MTVKTLIYIHQLLTENEAKMKNARDMTRRAMIEAEEAEAANFESLQKAYENMRKAFNEAEAARMDFEAREW